MQRLAAQSAFPNVILTLLLVACSILGGVAIGGGSSKIVLLAVAAGVIGLLLVTKPEYGTYIPLAAIVVTNTFPPLIYGDWLSVGSQGANVRPDFVLLLIGLLLVYGHSRHSQQQFYTPLDAPFGLLLVIALLADLISVIRGHSVGVGPMLRFVEGWIWFFIASRLTRREDIPRLTKLLAAVGIVLAGVLLVTSLTGSQELYTRFFVDSPRDVDSSKFYPQFYAGYERPRVWLSEGELLLQNVWTLGLASMFNSGLSLGWMGILLLLGLRSLSSLGRNFIGWLIVYFVVTIGLFMSTKRYPRWRIMFGSLGIIGVFALSLGILASGTEVWKDVLYWLGVRAAPTLEQAPYTYIGAQWARDEIIHEPIFLFLGAGAFAPKPYDINLPFVEIVFSLGIAGYLGYVWLFGKGLKQTWRLFNSAALSEAERPVVAMVLATCLVSLGGLILNVRPTTYVAHSLTLIPLAILLGWVQVIYSGVVGASAAEGKAR